MTNAIIIPFSIYRVESVLIDDKHRFYAKAIRDFLLQSAFLYPLQISCEHS
jgi:hypothetical protein